MGRLIMYPHGGSGNHGCEAIIRGTLKILNFFDEKYLFSSSVEEDEQWEIDKICKICKQTEPIKKASLGYFMAVIKRYVFKNMESYDRVAYRKIFSLAKGSVALSIGGDNYCYGVPKHIYFMNKYIYKQNAKLVLWGCSVEPTAIDREMAEDLRKYQLIVARESITYHALKDVNSNTILCPDPAFFLDRINLPLPKNFIENNMVGINISPLIIKKEKTKGITLENYFQLIDYILDNTKMGITLIPHVCWQYNDDRKPLNILYERYKDTGRVVILDEHNCMEMKGFIARCRFFVGARTHATIAAYSSCVPTLVVGYSVKARGIARDLFGTEENYVCPVQSLSRSDELIDHFKWVLDREKEIRSHLEATIPEYCKRISLAVEGVRKLV